MSGNHKAKSVNEKKKIEIQNAIDFDYYGHLSSARYFQCGVFIFQLPVHQSSKQPTDEVLLQTSMYF